MNILLVTGELPEPGAGGIGTVVRELTRMSEEDVEFEIVCSDSTAPPTDKITILNTRGKGIFGMMDYARKFRDFLRQSSERWDGIHFHVPNIGPLLGCPRSLLDRSIITFHTTAAGFRNYLYRKVPFRSLDTRGKVYKMGYAAVHEYLERLAIRRLHSTPLVSTVSTGIKREVESEYGLSVDAVIQNGIDSGNARPEVLPQESAKEPQILAVGRLVPQKGFQSGIEALKNVGHRFSLVIAGTGPLKSRLANACEDYGIDASFPGYVAEARLKSLYAQSDVLLMPSLYEGLPMVGLEGAANGLPIAAFERARVDDIVCEANRALLVENGATDRLANSVEMLVNDHDSAIEMGAKNRSRVEEQFTASGMASRYLDMYRQVCE